jgi:hypothetical protein
VTLKVFEKRPLIIFSFDITFDFGIVAVRQVFVLRIQLLMLKFL